MINPYPMHGSILLDAWHSINPAGCPLEKSHKDPLKVFINHITWYTM